jgi:TatD DNase family protein
VIFESHAHLHDAAFDADRAAVIQRAREAGIDRFVTVGCDLADSARALAVARDFGVDWSLGIHPHEAKGAPPDVATAFEAMLATAARPPVAIGETGLDYYYDHSPRPLQQDVMRTQVRFARERGFPVIFHQRDAFDDFVAILRDEWRVGTQGVVHCFTGDTGQARCFTSEFGLRLGIGGILTFKTAQAQRDAVADVGVEHIVLETDCPYLAPIPHRGKRNEPAFIVNTLETVARLLDLTPAEVAAKTKANAEALFRRS